MTSESELPDFYKIHCFGFIDNALVQSASNVLDLVASIRDQNVVMSQILRFRDEPTVASRGLFASIINSNVYAQTMLMQSFQELVDFSGMITYLQDVKTSNRPFHLLARFAVSAACKVAKSSPQLKVGYIHIAASAYNQV